MEGVPPPPTMRIYSALSMADRVDGAGSRLTPTRKISSATSVRAAVANRVERKRGITKFFCLP
jgi:hypothetical protein